MDKLKAMGAFVAIVDRGSLTAAADALNTSLPSVVRTLAALESELDVRLLNRTTRRIALTDEGREYCERCRRVLAEVDAAEAALSARRTTPKGRLYLTAPVLFGRLHVAPLVTAFIATHKALQVEMLMLDRVVDLVEEGIDAGVRIGLLPDSSLVAIPVGKTMRVVCGSPGYLKRAGVPKSPADLVSHRCVTSKGLSASLEWTFADGAGMAKLAIRPVFSSNQIETSLDACLRGIGLGQFLCYQVQQFLDDGRLRQVLVHAAPPALPIHVIYPHARLLSPNVRAFVDWTVPRLRATLRQS